MTKRQYVTPAKLTNQHLCKSIVAISVMNYNQTNCPEMIRKDIMFSCFEIINDKTRHYSINPRKGKSWGSIICMGKMVALRLFIIGNERYHTTDASSV